MQQKTSLLSRPFHFITALIIFILIVGISFLTGYAVGTDNNKATTDTNASTTKSTTLVEPAKPDPTANWLTYTNTNFDFSFKYPTGWTLTDHLQSSGNSNSEQSLVLSRDSDNTSITLNINSQDNNGAATPNVRSLSFSNNKLTISSDSSTPTSEKPVVSQFVGQINGNRYLFETSSISDSKTQKLVEQIIGTLQVNS